MKSVNIWQSYKQQRGCLMNFARLTSTLLTDEESPLLLTGQTDDTDGRTPDRYIDPAPHTNRLYEP